ncbi:MAG: hypothetical protein HC769_05585 [Cyanobacteria bacterium CRU_2_1]|nr:hypothetical protein [Cyanobacteria bacterium RU_5_0]NJR58363.1 hypothetical protein [Cyanobacteria bacterium CRU_2_1]
MSQPGFWDWEERQSKLNQKRDLLVRLNEIIPWQAFRPTLEKKGGQIVDATLIPVPKHATTVIVNAFMLMFF